MGRKHRNARKNRGARACAPKNPPKVQPPAPPPPETVEFPELPFDVIPLVLHALFDDGWPYDPGDDGATCRAAVRWSRLNKTHREACASDQVWEYVIARCQPNHTFEKTAGRELISIGREVCDNGHTWTMEYLSEPDPRSFRTTLDYFNALSNQCIALNKEKERLRECFKVAEKEWLWWQEYHPMSCKHGRCKLYTDPVYTNLIEAQYRVYMRILIVRGQFFYYDFLMPECWDLHRLAGKLIQRIRKNRNRMGDKWVSKFPDLLELFEHHWGPREVTSCRDGQMNWVDF